MENAEIIVAYDSVFSWYNEEPLVLVEDSVDVLRNNAYIVQGIVTQDVWLEMSAHFEHRFGEEL